MTPRLEEIINHGAKQNEIENYLKSNGMVFLKDDAEQKIASGITTAKEVEREVSL